MSEDLVWKPLYDELTRWKNAGRSVRFWLRDDDVIEPTGDLERLLALSNAYSVPVLLAAIPSLAGEPLAERLRPETFVSIAVHGWSHTNYAGNGQKKQELGVHRSLDAILAELDKGWRRTGELFSEQALPILVPPWNRIDASLLPYLHDLGYEALSAFGKAEERREIGIAVINTHVDLMDWHGTRGCRDHSALVSETVREMKNRFEADDSAVGILAHHLVHDESAWTFLKTLFEMTTETGGCRWMPARELI